MPDLNFLTRYLEQLTGVLVVLLIILAIFGKMFGLEGGRLLSSIMRGIGMLFTAVLTPIIAALWSILVQIAGHLAVLIGRSITAIADAIKYGGSSSSNTAGNSSSIGSKQAPINQIPVATENSFQTIDLNSPMLESQILNTSTPQTSQAQASSPYDQPLDIIIIHNENEGNN